MFLVHFLQNHHKICIGIAFNFFTVVPKIFEHLHRNIAFHDKIFQKFVHKFLVW